MESEDFDTLDGLPTIRADDGKESKLLADRYKSIRKLDEGGMGIVYLAEDTELGNTKVAIKFIPPMLAGNVRAIKNLKKEAQTAMQLSHPNIVRLHDLHTDGHQKFLVMEYIEGKTLDNLLIEKEDGKFTLEELLPIAEQIATGLDYAHSKKVLHRDLKPSNIMIDKNGTVKLLDFGIAREIRDSYTRITGQEDTSGTLPYMSPEQLMGEKPTCAMDIYSFGVVLYECLSGHPPFYTGDIREQIRFKRALRLDNVHHRVNHAILSALEKETDHRPKKSIELVEILSRTAARDEIREDIGTISVGDKPVDEKSKRQMWESVDITEARDLSLSTYCQDIDFATDPCGLHVGEGHCGVTSIEGGAYVMAARPKEYLGYEIGALPKMTDFVVEARIEKLAGPHDQWFGFEFGERYPGNYYQFFVNGKGVIKISKHWHRKWSDLGFRDNLRHIRRGNTENLLTVVRKGDKILVFVNKYHALVVEDMDIRIGGLGLAVGWGVRAAFSNLRIQGVELAALFERAMDHWEQLEVLEARRLLEYIHEYEPRYKHPKCPVDISQLLAEPRPDCSKSIIIAIASEALPQIYDGLIALKLKQEIDKRGSANDLEFACIVTDTAVLGDKRWLECPLISVGGHVVNRVTAEFVDKLPADPVGKGAVRVQHNIEGREKAVALWGDLRADTEEAVDLFISSGLLDRFLSMIWARELPNGKEQQWLT